MAAIVLVRTVAVLNYWDIALLSGYLDDVLFIPICYSVFLLFFPAKNSEVNLRHLLFSVGLTFVLVEIVFGLVIRMNTYDPYDLLAYFLGALIVVSLKKIL